MDKSAAGLDLSDAVQYHYGRFPPEISNYRDLLKPLSSAASALARYDQMLKGMHDSGILLAPLRSQEAVVSSRMEGTISTLDEVLRYEAEQEGDKEKAENHFRSEAIEVHLYSRAMRSAQAAIGNGTPISNWLIRSAHRQLLSFGRGASMSPGSYKTEQNYLADKSRKKVLFTPINPDQLQHGMDNLLNFMGNDDWEILLRAALVHLEFEALHPFKDGNGRIGRMLIPLMLWKYGAISQPHFYMSGFLEQRRDSYIDLMRRVSSHDDWLSWIVFFLEAVEAQANENLSKAEQIRGLYERMKEEFRIQLASQWSTSALDFVFKRPVFRNNIFTGASGIPFQTAHRFSRLLAECGLLKTVVPASGRRPAMYSFEPLLEIVRA